MKNAVAIAERISSEACIDQIVKNGFPTQEYIRFRVNLQLRKPLLVDLFLPMPEGVNLWCYFKYENVPQVCYKCGVIFHEEVLCHREHKMITGDFERDVPMYRPWIQLGSRIKDCFSEYAPYERDMLEQEVAAVQGWEELRQHVLQKGVGFEPFLLGTEIHREAITEVANNDMVSGDGPSAELPGVTAGAVSSS
ncbi:hypothetical protein G4B88_019409 [Cannabis sativa]|uniref:Zinc knuckle CX2CX4HX4C domain-containing protein n=1 Tax=Cannabis sativa TaxID=3483 RepID=A0A7J6I0N9_CANSA|nr:hypothetical protein G4B88_019409 [Cannabis sativa]